MKKKPIFYYIFGAITLSIGIIVVCMFAFLPSMMKEQFDTKQYLGWICLILVVVGLLISFLGIFLLKKGNFVRLNKHLDGDKKEEENDKNNMKS